MLSRLICLCLLCVPLLALDLVEIKEWKVTVVDRSGGLITTPRASIRLPDQSIVSIVKPSGVGEISLDFVWRPGLELWVDARSFYVSRLPLIRPPTQVVQVTLKVIDDWIYMEGISLKVPSIWQRLRYYFRRLSR